VNISFENILLSSSCVTPGSPAMKCCRIYEKHKAHGHTTADCFVRKRLEKEKAQGRVADETIPTDNTVANAN